MKITLVELPATLNGTLWEKPVKDFFSVYKLPSRGIPVLNAILQQHGYNDVVQINPSFNRSGMLTKDELNRLISSDVVGISTLSRTTPQSYDLARLIKEYNPDCWIVMGGTHVSALADEALDYCDIVVRQEGDKTLPQLMERISEDSRNPYLETQLGISYKSGMEKIHNESQPFLTNEELSSLPYPVYREQELKKCNIMAMITSRGCPYNCEYCSVIANFGARFRFMDDDSVIDHFKQALATGHDRFFIADDSFAANTKRTKRLLTRMLDENIKVKRYTIQARVESAYDTELLQLLRETGCTYVCIGIESINDATLELYNKKSSQEKNSEAIKRFHEHGLSVHGMFVLGAETDTIDTFKQTLEYARKLKIETAQFFAITPLPGTPMTKRYEEEGRILTKAYHKYDAQHVVVSHPTIEPSEMQLELDKMNSQFYSIHDAFVMLFTGYNKDFGFIIRLLGKNLYKKVQVYHEDYLKGLIEIEEWKNKLLSELEKLKSETIKSNISNQYQDKKQRIVNKYNTFKENAFNKKEFFAHWRYSEIKDYCQTVLKRADEEARNYLKQFSKKEADSV